MDWFLKRISSSPHPLFGQKDENAHPKDFEFLVKGGILVHTGNLDEFECDLCDEGHITPIRLENKELFIVCEKGCGRRKISSKELAIFEFEINNFFKVVANELNIKQDSGSFQSKDFYANDSLYYLGTYESKSKKLKTFYLRDGNDFEISPLASELKGEPTIVISNITKPKTSGPENLFFCPLLDILAPTSVRSIFDKSKFINTFDGARRVFFNQKQGTLYLDGKIVYTAALNGPHHYFLDYLWQNWEKQMTYADIYGFARKKMGKEVADTYQKFCQKMKNEIKKDCKQIDKIIKNPTTGHYMMADPTSDK